MDTKKEEAKRCFITQVNFFLNMWNDSGETYYLQKAIAAIEAQIKKEAQRENQRAN